MGTCGAARTGRGLGEEARGVASAVGVLFGDGTTAVNATEGLWPQCQRNFMEPTFARFGFQVTRSTRERVGLKPKRLSLAKAPMRPILVSKGSEVTVRFFHLPRMTITTSLSGGRVVKLSRLLQTAAAADGLAARWKTCALSCSRASGTSVNA